MSDKAPKISIYSAIRILKKTTGTKRLLLSFVIFQTLAILDLLGVLIFGYIGSLVLNGINSDLPKLGFEFLPSRLSLEGVPLQVRVVILTSFAVGLLLFRSACSIYFTKRNLTFLGNRSAQTSGKLIELVVSGKHKKTLNLSSELYTVTSGVQQLYSSVVGNLLGAMADLLLSLTFIIGIMFVDVLTSITVASLFILLAWALNSFFSPRARSNGKAVGELTRQSQQEVLDTIQLFREIRLRGVSDQHSEKITNTRRKLYRFLVPNQIYGMLNKYLIEGFLLLLVSVIAGILFLLYDASTGFAKLAIFFIASSRIAPALVRLQQSLFQAKNNIAQALQTLEAIAEISEVNLSNSSPAPVMTRSNYGSPSPTIRVENLTYSYRGSRNQKSDWRLELQNLTISAGKVVAVVGHSGSGKTTLVDLLLGFKSPDTGSVRIDELSVQQIVSSLPGFLGYVPQDVYLMNSTIRENISLMDPRFDNEEEILRVLEIVGLRQWVDELPNGINTVIGTGSLTPSGGQRQRIGLARCLISKPGIIVLDEVTSGLDVDSEKSLISELSSIPWQNTQIWVTHRQAVADLADIKVEVRKNGRIFTRNEKVEN